MNLAKAIQPIALALTLTLPGTAHAWFVGFGNADAAKQLIEKGQARGVIMTKKDPGGAPAAPAGLRIVPTGAHRADLSWRDRASNEQGFTIERKPAGGRYMRCATLPRDATGYTDLDFDSISTFYYRVSAFNAYGRSSCSNEIKNDTVPTVQFAAANSSGSETTAQTAIEVVLSGPCDTPVAVRYETTGGFASDIPEGSGRDYLPLSGELSFSPGTTSQMILLQVVNDSINETDETVEILLSGPSNAFLGDAPLHTFTIIDDDRKMLANIRDYGARGDGSTDDTAAIQAAVDAVYAAGGGVVFFPPSAQPYMATSINVRENITYEGYGTVVKREPLSYFTGHGIPTDKRTFTTVNYQYSGNSDSPPLIFKGLILDGNSSAQGAYQNYELEQAALLLLNGDNAAPGRLKAIIENMTFRNGVGDGVHVVYNVDFTLFNCSAINVFRGGFVNTGGYSISRVKNLTTRGDIDPTGIDVEVDSPGYGNSFAVQAYLENLNLMDGDFDVAPGKGSYIEADNVYADAPFYLYSRESTATYRNSLIGVSDGGLMGTLLYPRDVTFDNCEFFATERYLSEADREYAFAAPFVSFNISTTIVTGQTVTFNRCTFSTADDIDAADTVYGVLTGWDRMDRNNTVNVNDCYFSPRLDVGMGTRYQGGRWKVRNGSNAAALPFSWGSDDGSGEAFVDLSLDGITAAGTRYMHINGYPAATANTLEHRDVTADESVNRITSFYGIEGNTYTGSRLVLGAAPPTAQTNGFPGDIYRLKDPVSGQVHEWQCTQAGYWTGSTLHPAAWSALPAVPVIAALKDLPASPDDTGSAAVTVGGADVTHYKYKLDSDLAYGAEASVNVPLRLNGLSNGKHILSVIGKNAANTWQDSSRATTFVWTVEVDTVPPGGNVLIGQGVKITASRDVTLALHAFDRSAVTEMKVSNSSDFSSAAAEPCVTAKAWTLTPGSGNKTVHVWFKDGHGNWTPPDKPFIDRVILYPFVAP